MEEALCVRVTDFNVLMYVYLFLYFDNPKSAQRTLRMLEAEGPEEERGKFRWHKCLLKHPYGPDTGIWISKTLPGGSWLMCISFFPGCLFQDRTMKSNRARLMFGVIWKSHRLVADWSCIESLYGHLYPHNAQN